MLDKMEKEGVDTELINFCDYNVKPCQDCDYECLPRIDPDTGQKEYRKCPVKYAVEDIWRRVWHADFFLMFVPTYGGLSPALYVRFTQRYQSLWREAPPKEELQRKVVAAVVLASHDGVMGGELTPAIVAGELRCHISMQKSQNVTSARRMIWFTVPQFSCRPRKLLITIHEDH